MGKRFVKTMALMMAMTFALSGTVTAKAAEDGGNVRIGEAVAVPSMMTEEEPAAASGAATEAEPESASGAATEEEPAAPAAEADANAAAEPAAEAETAAGAQTTAAKTEAAAAPTVTAAETEAAAAPEKDAETGAEPEDAGEPEGTRQELSGGEEHADVRLTDAEPREAIPEGPAAETAPADETEEEISLIPVAEDVITEEPANAIGAYSFDSAYPIGLNSRVSDSATGNGNSRANYYRFTLPSAGVVSLSMSHAYLNNASWYMYLYTDTDKGNELTYWSVPGKEENYRTCNIGLPAGTYYVKITSYYTDNYYLTVNYTASSACETERNNSFDSADGLVTGKEMTGSLMSGSDEDYYRFTLAKAGVIYINFSHPYIDYNYTYWNLYLYPANDKATAMYSVSYTGKVDGNVKSAGIGLPAGTYYIKINDSSFSAHDYRLKVDFTASGVWESEYNSSFTTADPVVAGTTYYGGLLDYYDKDYYRFTVGRRSTVSVTFAHPFINDNWTYWNASLYNENDKVNAVKQWKFKGSDTRVTTESVTVPAGTYYLEITDGSFSAHNYNFRINAAVGGWKQAANGKWWYAYIGGGYPKDAWELINNRWYHFDRNGYMQTGWVKVNGRWFYLSSGGDMQTGWQKIAGKWYYMDATGAMQTGWVKVGSKWYHLDAKGVMQTGWLKVNGKWYHLDAKGVMQTGWLLNRGRWFYLDAKGVMQTGWLLNRSRWFYLDGNGVMQTGWLKQGGTWYYLKSDGVMAANETLRIGGKTYRFGAKGNWI